MRRRGRLPLLQLTAASVVVALAASGCAGPPTGGEGAAPATPTTGGRTAADGSTPNPSGPLRRDPPVVEPVAWEACHDGFGCATVEVPLDHDNPAGATTTVALIRVPAGDPQRREGSLFVNPGGPGASGIDLVRSGFRFDAETMARFDLVGFDPRGVGQSDPLGCEPDLTIGPLPDPSPDTEAEAEQLDAEAARVASRCARTDGERLAHLDSEDVARDLDLLRQAVGDEELHYYGFSYGTLLALRYLELFPATAGRVVLDGVVDPAATLGELLGQQAEAFEDAFATEMAAACTGSPRCPPGGLLASYDAVAAGLEAAPVGQVGPAELATAAVMATYDQELWDVLFRALDEAASGDVAGIERLSDLYYGSYSFGAYLAVSCTDTPTPRGPGGWDELATEVAAAAPRFGASTVNELRPCAHWPVRSDRRLAPVRADGSGPVLVIGTTGDAATPVENAVAVADHLAEGHLLVHQGEGHAAYGTSDCVQEIVRRYLVDGEVPAAGARC